MAIPGRYLCLAYTILAATAVVAAQDDEHTLLRCSYDRSATADFSVGSPHATGVVSLGEGKSGAALSVPLGIIPFAQSVAPITTGIRYATEGNFNLQQGTLELWVQVYGDIIKTTADSPKLRYLISSGKYIGENHGFALVLSHFEGKPGEPYRLLWTRGNGAAKEKTFSVSFMPAWQTGEWHHVAVTYSPTEDALYVDGKCVGKTATTDGMDLIGDRLTVGASNYQSYPADCAIDDLRISDNIRYTADFTP
ncbi:MAG: LamG domain-containing protein [Armatimonadota bacterium]